MNTRLALLDYCARHQVDSSTTQGLWRLAGFDIPPPSLTTHIRLGLAAVSALLLGAGLVCWIAANWSNLGRPLQFGMLEAMVLLPCIGAALWSRLRTGMALFAFIAIGALFAYFGQTYQTGADPWQLFALWSALGLPLVIVVRAEILRVAWVGVAMTAIGLWSNGGNGVFRNTPDTHAVIGCAAALLLALSLSRSFRHLTQAGPYSSGVAIATALGLVSMIALPGIVARDGHGAATILVLLVGLVTVFYARTASFDIVALCACALALNFLIDTAVVSATLSGPFDDILGPVFIIGVVACGFCGLSIAAILATLRRQLHSGDSNE
ncbi:DUF2157 domain-containing protein [Massilia sp. S19_KUP03_FR1]|uniref:DUF2157 domain-containing protein n=1 Tax=Massilia sp. S19_KUP03_FR1 TaxID=3025503 RepID=UPI002FCDCDA2